MDVLSAVENNDIEFIRQWLEAGGNPNLSIETDRDIYPILYAYIDARADQVRLMRQYGGNLEQCLLDAVRAGNWDAYEGFTEACRYDSRNIPLNFDTGAGSDLLVLVATEYFTTNFNSFPDSKTGIQCLIKWGARLDHPRRTETFKCPDNPTLNKWVGHHLRRTSEPEYRTLFSLFFEDSTKYNTILKPLLELPIKK